MAWSEIIFGTLLVGVLLVLSTFFGWRQLRQIRRLRMGNLPVEEARHERSKAYRRLVTSGVTLVLGLLLTVLLGVYGPPVQRLADERAGFDAATAPDFTPEQVSLLRVWGWSWVAMLLLLLVVIGLAMYDLWATRRHGRRQLRKIQSDRRAMIKRQTIRLRQEREEQG